MKTQNNLKITNEDFFNYIQELNATQLKGLNYKLSEVEPMLVSTGINGDSYESLLVGIERKGKTLLIKKVGEYAIVEKYTFKNGSYRLKGYNFGHVNFNSFTNYRVREI
tara:strand:- start:577 stop:903 length:327 start_codon:yes stop_codon:yes gene_type:complete